MFKDRRTAMIGTLVLALFLLSLILTNPGKLLAVDVFLKIDGVKGESTDDKHKDEIEVISWSFGDSQTVSANRSMGGGAGAGRVKMQDLKITMRTNKASPMLFQAVATGQHFPEVNLYVCKSDASKQRFLWIKLSNVIVSSFLSMGSAGPNIPYPVDEILLNFGKIDITYTQMDQTGRAAGDIKVGWDVIKNVKY